MLWWWTHSSNKLKRFRRNFNSQLIIQSFTYHSKFPTIAQLQYLKSYYPKINTIQNCCPIWINIHAKMRIIHRFGAAYMTIFWKIACLPPKITCHIGGIPVKQHLTFNTERVCICISALSIKKVLEDGPVYKSESQYGFIVLSFRCDYFEIKFTLCKHLLTIEVNKWHLTYPSDLNIVMIIKLENNNEGVRVITFRYLMPSKCDGTAVLKIPILGRNFENCTNTTGGH